MHFVPRKRFKLHQIVKICHFVPEKRFGWNQIMAAEINMVTTAPHRSGRVQSATETTSIADNLAGNKRIIYLNIRILR